MTRELYILYVSPVYVKGAHNPRLVEQSIPEMFGDVKLSEDIIKIVCQDEFYIPVSFANFMVQLRTCYQTLELFTC
jgi:hypothetical protein